jgi:predicted permease
MQTVLSITIPFFSIIFLGTFLRARNVFNEEASRILTKFAFFVTLPPYVFLNIVKSSNTNIFQWDFIIRFEIVTILIITFSFLFSKFFFQYNNRRASLFSLNSSYPNYGFLGIPLCILAFGKEAAIPISMILFADTIVLLTFTTFFASNTNELKIYKNLFFIFINMIKNPLLVAVLIGFVFVIFNIPLYPLIYKVLNILSAAAPPTLLFALGVMLWNKVDIKFVRLITVITIFRLIIHPLLVFCIFYYFPSSISPLWINVAVLSSCLPVAVTAFAMAGYYETYIKETSSSILVTTILSIISVSTILYLLL